LSRRPRLRGQRRGKPPIAMSVIPNIATTIDRPPSLGWPPVGHRCQLVPDYRIFPEPRYYYFAATLARDNTAPRREHTMTSGTRAMRGTRRDLGRMALGGVPAAALAMAAARRSDAAPIDSRIRGVQIGAITYRFRAQRRPRSSRRWRQWAWVKSS
jgi:hypothetical protein